MDAEDRAALELWLRGNVFALDNLGRGDEIPGAHDLREVHGSNRQSFAAGDEP